MRIVYVPLDDRPLNYAAILRAAAIAETEILVPPRELVGLRDFTPSLLQQAQWLASKCDKSTYLILSLDALLHGGLIQARSLRTDRERIDNAMILLSKLAERTGDIHAYYVVKRLWGNVFHRKELDRTEDWGRFSQELAAEVRRSGRSAADFYRLCGEGECSIGQWPPDELQTLARQRLEQLEEERAVIRLCGKLGIQLHLAVEDCVPDGVQEVELEYLLEEHSGKGVTVADGADEAGAVLLSGALMQATDGKPIPVIAPGLTGVVAPYESRTVGENLRVLTELAGAEIAEEPAAFAVELTGKPEPNDPYLDVVAGKVSVPEFTQLLDRAEPLKAFDEQRVIVDLTVTNGVNSPLLDEVLTAERLPLAIVQCNTVSNRIGHALLLGRLLRSAHASDETATAVVGSYMEDLLYLAYLRTWVIARHGGMEPSDPRTLAAAENSLCSMAERFAQKKFSGASFRGGIVEVGEVRLHLPWRR